LAFDGNGNFTPVHNWQTDKANGIKIRADRMDEQDDDIADGLTACVTRDGQSPATANLPMGGFRHTGVGAASASTDYMRADQAQTNGLTYLTASGTNTYTITPSPTVASMVAGLGFWVRFTNANTSTTCTLAIGAHSAVNLVKGASTALAVGDITAGMIAFCQYDGTNIQVHRVRNIELGTHTIPVPASAMSPRLTNGASYDESETTTNDVMVCGFLFDQSTDEAVQFSIPMPNSWDEGTVTVQFYWTTSVASGNVVWTAAAVSFADGDVLDTAFGTAQSVTDGSNGTGDINISSFTSAITVAGSPAAGEMVYFQILRDANAAGDTLAGDAKLLGVKVNITINAPTD
jgi:hypothetical protein